jgi:hypothetical protein
VTAQIASSGGADRTGSTDRCDWDIWCDDTLSAATAAVLSWLDGAQQVGGSVRIQGNLSGGTSADGGYGLRLSGQAPASSAATNYAQLVNVALSMNLEVDGSGGTAPATVLVDTDCEILNAAGVLWFQGLDAATITGDWQYFGPITGDNTLADFRTFGDYPADPSGWTGHIYVSQIAASSLFFLESALTVPSSTTLTQGTTLVTGIAAPYLPSVNKLVSLVAFVSGGADVVLPCALNASGTLVYEGASVTFTSGGSVQGSVVYSAGV